MNHFINKDKYLKKEISFLKNRNWYLLTFFSEEILESVNQNSTWKWHPLSKVAIMIYKSKIIGFLSGFECYDDVIKRRDY